MITHLLVGLLFLSFPAFGGFAPWYGRLSPGNSTCAIDLIAYLDTKIQAAPSEPPLTIDPSSHPFFEVAAITIYTNQAGERLDAWEAALPASTAISGRLNDDFSLFLSTFMEGVVGTRIDKIVDLAQDLLAKPDARLQAKYVEGPGWNHVVFQLPTLAGYVLANTTEIEPQLLESIKIAGQNGLYVSRNRFMPPFRLAMEELRQNAERLRELGVRQVALMRAALRDPAAQ